ncbi:MAG TPA: DUF5694 domain-containing protein [Arenimonas sp.]|uniref:DUF5694 domain-containing protein n=1 Tax=Arenimonas sp. TaxID=1872635 RepID=UPI002D7E8DD6|nr:DUF5694 domain-containing protein [Arenimonas sp.]HEU0154375.1 DUF5694 domain-containing protein [Arenimonas sp.]
MVGRDLMIVVVACVGLFASPFTQAAHPGPAQASAAGEVAKDVRAVPHAQAFDPRTYQDKVAGPLTQVLVLGVPHLSGTPEDFDPAVLEPLLDRLQAFAPDLIAIENLSGESLFTLQAYAPVYPDVADMFGSRFLTLAADARAVAGIASLPEAEAAVRRALGEAGADPSPSQRRRLALLFLASGDPNSAVVQWWRLPETERKPGEEMPEALAAALDRFAAGRNESRMIGARLAARRGLERVHPMDDQSAVDVVLPVFEALAEAVKADAEISARLARPEFVRLGTAVERLDTPARTLATMRELNRPESGVLDAYSQWLVMLDREFPMATGRVRMAEWESRNLRMAANIREASAAVPGGRVLVVVGSAHKPWLDAYLGLMSDMRVVDALEVLE